MGLTEDQPATECTVDSDLSKIYLSGDIIYLMEDWGMKSAAYYCIDTFLSDILFIWQVLREQMTLDKSEPTVFGVTIAAR